MWRVPQDFREHGRRFLDMLEVIENEQHSSVAQGQFEGVQQRTLSRFPDAERLRDGGRNLGRMNDRRNVDDLDVAGERFCHPTRDFQRQLGFAHPSRSRQGDQSRAAVQPPENIGELPLAADKRFGRRSKGMAVP